MQTVKHYTLLILFLSANHIAFSQFAFEKKTDVAVTENSDTLTYPWTGGLNNPQFAPADLNNDGIDDLVIFDRVGFVVLTFINHGTAGKIDYTFVPQYARNFPNVEHWMLMDDYNCDGIQDLFYSHPATIEVYLGSYNSNDELQFDSIGILQYNSFTGTLPIFVTSLDVPAIADINGDGDLDVLKLNETSGPRTVTYYENQSIETNGNCSGNLPYALKDECWGRFVETGVSIKVAFDSCGYFKRAEESAEANGVSYSFLAFDKDGDNDKDLFMGLSISTNINLITNGGKADSAFMVSEETDFPTDDIRYDSYIFALPSLLDVNNDGLDDLVIAPRELRRSENFSCAWHYKNAGTSDSASFQFQTETFIINESLDFGEGAHPAFLDYNADGLLDVVVGNFGYYDNGVTYLSELALLENTGTIAAHAFKLITRDYSNISQLSGEAVYPSFGDMDDDGDVDMIIGEVDGFLHFYRNTAGAGNTANFTLELIQMFGIDVGQFSAPFIYDVNGDSLPDLLVGEKGGNINYFENIGTATNFIFDTLPTIEEVGDINVRVGNSITGYSAPAISALDSTGTLYLLSGCEEGTIKVYQFNRDSLGNSFNELFPAYSGIDEGERSVPAIADLDNDGKLEMLVGNYRGGVAFFKQTNEIYAGVIDFNATSGLVFYPNPANRTLYFEIPGSNEEQIEIEFFDLAGRKIFHLVTDGVSQNLELPELKTGLYLLKASTESKVWTGKVVIQ